MLGNGNMERLLGRDQLLRLMARHGLFRNFHEVNAGSEWTDIGTCYVSPNIQI